MNVYNDINLRWSHHLTLQTRHSCRIVEFLRLSVPLISLWHDLLPHKAVWTNVYQISFLMYIRLLPDLNYSLNTKWSFFKHDYKKTPYSKSLFICFGTFLPLNMNKYFCRQVTETLNTVLTPKSEYLSLEKTEREREREK